MILIFDTETTGLPDNAQRKNWRHESQPWPVSVAGILLDGDLKEVETYHHVVRVPDGIESHPRALATHGITREKMNAEGLPPATILADFQRLVGMASIHMAYNLPFDDAVMKAFAHRLGHPDASTLFGDSEGTCLLRTATNFLKIPGGHEGYRQVKLFQAFRRITGRKMEDVYTAHDALEDVRACADIYRAMIKAVVV